MLSSWCKKMDQDIHNQDAFREKMIGRVLFVKVDLPGGVRPDKKTEELLKKYDVVGVPTVVLLSPTAQELGRFRYQQIPGQVESG